jgi:hypothetical protein
MSDAIRSERIIARCGLICSECPAYIATKDGDEQKIAETAAMWSKMYNAEVKPEYVWCDGCALPGRKCGHCAECDVRACAESKGMDNCGFCNELSECATINNFFQLAPGSKIVIEEVAAGR